MWDTALINRAKAHGLSPGAFCRGYILTLALILVPGALGVLAIGGCMSVDQMAPPVGQTMVQWGREQGFETAHLRRGRQVYITNCAKCHTVEPIDRYSPKRWAKILPEMSAESKLSAQDTRKLEAYIKVAGGFMTRPDAHGPDSRQ